MAIAVLHLACIALAARNAAHDGFALVSLLVNVVGGGVATYRLQQRETPRP